MPSPLLNKQVTREKQRAFPPTVLLAKFEKAAGNLRPPPLSGLYLAAQTTAGAEPKPTLANSSRPFDLLGPFRAPVRVDAHLSPTNVKHGPCQMHHNGHFRFTGFHHSERGVRYKKPHFVQVLAISRYRRKRM